MATIAKLLLSGSVNGRSILVASTASGSATAIHTSVSGTTDFDEVYLYAYNEATSSVLLSVLWGGTIEPNDVVRVTVPSQTGRTLVEDGRLLQNGLIISAYAAVSSSVTIDGFVNRITA